MLKVFKKIKLDFSFAKKVVDFVKDLRSESEYARKKIDRLLISFSVFFICFVTAILPKMFLVIAAFVALIYFAYILLLFKEE